MVMGDGYQPLELAPIRHPSPLHVRRSEADHRPSHSPNASFKVGTTPTAVVTFLGANVYSFDTDTDVLADTREYKVTLETADGKPFSLLPIRR